MSLRMPLPMPLRMLLHAVTPRAVLLSETLGAIRAHTASDRDALSLQLLRELQPELIRLVECARVFAAQALRYVTLRALRT